MPRRSAFAAVLAYTLEAFGPPLSAFAGNALGPHWVAPPAYRGGTRAPAAVLCGPVQRPAASRTPHGLPARWRAQSSGVQVDAWRTLTPKAETIADQLFSGDFAALREQMTDQMKATLTEVRLREVVSGVVLNAGRFIARKGSRTETRAGMHIVSILCEFERGLADIHVAFDANHRIAGLSARPAASAVEYTAPPYVTASAFTQTEVTVGAPGWPLPGTLSMPTGTGPLPAVVLVHGSGPNDRDSSFGPNKPFRDLAQGLASRGIAVLQYDKRTRVHSRRLEKLPAFTVRDEVIDDAVAAAAALRRMPGIQADKVFIIGHSLGGMLAPRIGAADPRLAGLILLAGAVRPLEQSILDQTRYLAELDGNVSKEEQSLIDTLSALPRRVAALKASDPPLVAASASAPASYWLDMRGYHPPSAARTLTQPMLVLQGERDYQVTMSDFGEWKRTLGSRQNVEFRSYAELNHMFAPGTGKSSPAEYSQPGHVAEEVVRDVADWIRRH